jgi:hypothetical protein
MATLRPPKWAAVAVRDTDIRDVDPVTLARLFAASKAWNALPSDDLRLAVLNGIAWFDATHPTDDPPRPSDVKRRGGDAASKLRAAAAALAHNGHYAFVAGFEGISRDALRAAADRVEREAQRLRFGCQPRPRAFVLHLSSGMKQVTGRYYDAVTAGLATAYLDLDPAISANAVKLLRRRCQKVEK